MPNETIFEWMERTRFVDLALMWAALAGPLVVAGLAFLLRDKAIVRHHRSDWVLAVVSLPVLFLLWRAYNAIIERFGLETIRASILALLLFAAATAALAALARMLDARLGSTATGEEGAATGDGPGRKVRLP